MPSLGSNAPQARPSFARPLPTRSRSTDGVIRAHPGQARGAFSSRSGRKKLTNAPPARLAEEADRQRKRAERERPSKAEGPGVNESPKNDGEQSEEDGDFADILPPGLGGMR
jgi:hypothetical protein